jgi:predicted transcriptional regulator
VDYLSPIKSELKLSIILSLLTGEKNLSQLKSVIDARETTILHVLKEFEKLSLSEKSHGTYKLTSLGLLEAQISRQCFEASEVIGKFKEFWLSHDISAIPEAFIARLGSLKDASLIKAESSELGKVHETFMQVLLSSKTIKGISPIFHPDYVAAFRHLLSQGNSVELILTSSVFSKTLGSADAELLQKYIIEDKLTIFIKEDLKFALTVTESSFSLGLFGLNGEYDYANDLISLSPPAIEWGEELFKVVLAGSEKFAPK